MFTATTPPTPEDCSAMWEVIDFPELQWSHPAVDAYVEELATLYGNGEVIFHSFQLPEHPTFEWYLQHQLHDCNFFRRFWSAPSPSRFFEPASSDWNYYQTYNAKTVFRWQSPLRLAGELAILLAEGGCYSGGMRHQLRANTLGQAAAHELLKDDFDQTFFFASQRSWSRFFRDIAWDNTIVFVSKGMRQIHCLLATDSD